MSNHSLISILFLIKYLLGCLAVPLSAQSDYRIEKYDARNGLQHHWVSGVERDSTGFVWVSLLEGALARFDGSTFRHFPMNEAERQQVGSNQILRFHIEDGKNFYLNIDHNFARFDPATGRFSPLDEAQTKALSPKIVERLQFHFTQTKDWKLTGNPELVRQRDGAAFDLPEKAGVNDVLDTGNEIWVAAFEGLFKITPRRRLFEPLFSQPFGMEQGPPTGMRNANEIRVPFLKSASPRVNRPHPRCTK
ncbi:MAG: hypothetical protein ABMA02_19105 [Saprospiraceae bacterium]